MQVVNSSMASDTREISSNLIAIKSSKTTTGQSKKLSVIVRESEVKTSCLNIGRSLKLNTKFLIVFYFFLLTWESRVFFSKEEEAGPRLLILVG